MITVDEVKTALRITHDKLNDEIQSTIIAAMLDLMSAGMDGRVSDELVDTAIKLYAKWQYDYCGKGEQYGKAYGDLKTVLALVNGEVAEG